MSFAGNLLALKAPPTTTTPSKAGAGVPASRVGPRGRVEAGRNPERQL